MIYTCQACRRSLATKRSDAIEAAGGFAAWLPVVSYSAVLRFEDSEPFYCCADCAEERPGKFEGNYGRHARGIAQILYALSLDGSEDDYMSAEGQGYVAMIGRYLLMEDTSGFVTFEEYDNEAKAQARFDDLYADGMGYSEDDAVIAEDGSVWFDGKQLDVWSPQNRRDMDYDQGITERRRLARIRLEMMRTGFYPNVWRENRYGVELVKNV